MNVFMMIEYQAKNHSNETHKLNLPIATEQVVKTGNKMSNNKSSEFDNVTGDMIKYGPHILHQEITNNLNNIFESHSKEIGRSILKALPKPNKSKGPCKNLRPINLLITIRKILSNLTLQRINPKVNKYLSQSQSTYREGRSTTDIIWTYKWIIAKVQRQKGTKIFITGIDMTAAFNTILRKALLEELETFLNEDQIRMCRVLLSDTTISIRINNTTSEPFPLNI